MSNLGEKLSPTDCDPQARTELLKERLKDFEEDVIDTFNEIASLSFGAFLPTLFALTAQFTSSTILNYGSFLGAAISKNTIGGLVSMVGFGIASFNGFKIMLKYLAAKRLRDDLNTRIAFMKALGNDVDNLLQILISFRDVNINTDVALLADIERSLKHVKLARRIVGRETTKLEVENFSGFSVTNIPVNPQALNQASSQIDFAMVELSGAHLLNDDYTHKLKKLNKKFKLTVVPKNKFVDDIGIVNPLGVLEFFQESVENITKIYSNNGTLTDKGQQVLREYIIDFIRTPGINQFFRTYAAAQFMGNYLTSIGLRIPIDSVVAGDFGVSVLDKLLSPEASFKSDAQAALDDAFEYIKIKPYTRMANYPGDDNLTLSYLNLKIRGSQSSILLMNDQFESIRVNTGFLKNFLIPSYNNLTTVQNKMTWTLDQNRSYVSAKDKADLAASKLEWMSRLSLAKTLLNSGTEPSIYVGSQSISPYQVNQQFKKSNELYNDLQDLIQENQFDGNGEVVNTQAEEIVKTANKYLKSFILGPLSLFNPRSRQSAIKNLQSIKTLISKQISEDNQQRNSADLFIRSVEDNPLFMSVIKPAWDEFIESLKGAPLAGRLWEELNDGNLSTLLKGIRVGGLTIDTTKRILNCKINLKGEADQAALDELISVIGANKEESKKIAEKARNSINRLNNEKTLLNILLQE